MLCDMAELILLFYVKRYLVMVIRSGDVTDIAWVFAGLDMKCLDLFNTSPRCNYGSAISQLGVLVTPHRKFGVCSSRRLGITSVPIWEVHIF